MEKLNMKKNDTTGYLFTFCGLDGCGKTTMIRRLAADLAKEYDVFVTRQPTDAVRRSGIFRTYMDCEDHDGFEYRALSLLAAGDRLQHGSKVIEKEMKKGKIVISDRYFYSCLANLHARGYEEDRWIYEVAEWIVRPDLAFFLDLPVEESVARVRRRPEEKDRYIDMPLQYRLRREYLAICQENGGILLSTEKPEEVCYLAVKNAVSEVLSHG